MAGRTQVYLELFVFSDSSLSKKGTLDCRSPSESQYRHSEHYRVPLKHVGMFPDSGSFSTSQNNVESRISLLKQISQHFM